MGRRKHNKERRGIDMQMDMGTKPNGQKQIYDGKVTPEFKESVDRVFKVHRKVLDELAKH